MSSVRVENARKQLSDRVDESKERCAQIAKEYKASDFEGRPQDGVRLFFPRIHLLYKRGISYASGMAREETSPSILQLLLFGLPILVDLRPDFACSAETFQKSYGMSPDEFARESRFGDIIAIINDKDPLENWSDDALEYIHPIISNAQLEFAHYSLNSYFSWALGEKDLKNIQDEGREIYKAYFRCNDEERGALAVALRIGSATDKVIENVVIGRWRNIVPLRPGVAADLKQVLHELRDSTPAERAVFLNGMKHFVASSVTVGRGGVFRPSQTQIEDMQKTYEIVQEKETLKNMIYSDLGEGYWTAKISKLLKKMGVVPDRESLDYDFYLELKKHPFSEEFGQKARKLVKTLEFTTKNSSIPQIEECLEDMEAMITEQYERAKNWQRPVEKFSGLFVTIGLGLGDVAAPGSTVVIKEGVRSGIDRLASSGSVSPPGWQLHQIVRRAGQTGWPADAAIATKKRDPDVGA